MENKINSGAIFRNTYKKEGDKSPDYRGKIDVDGKPKEIALWLNPAKDGKKAYFGAKISDPYVKPATDSENIETAIPDVGTGKEEDTLPF